MMSLSLSLSLSLCVCLCDNDRRSVCIEWEAEKLQVRQTASTCAEKASEHVVIKLATLRARRKFSLPRVAAYDV